MDQQYAKFGTARARACPHGSALFMCQGKFIVSKSEFSHYFPFPLSAQENIFIYEECRTPGSLIKSGLHWICFSFPLEVHCQMRKAGNGDVIVREFVIVFSRSLSQARQSGRSKPTNFHGPLHLKFQLCSQSSFPILARLLRSALLRS